MARRHIVNSEKNRNENVKGTREASLVLGSPEESGNAHRKEATRLPASPPTTPGLGTVMVGTLRPENAPTSTPRQTISNLLGAEEAGKDVDGDHREDLRAIICKEKISGKRFDKEIGEGGAFSSYTPEEKVIKRILFLLRFSVARQG